MWAARNNILHSSLNELLFILKEDFPAACLPSDARSLLKTPRQSDIKHISPGKYCHFGILNSIVHILETENDFFKLTKIQLKIGIDGLPLNNFSNSQLWPILGSIIPSSTVFLIGAYHGYTKPSDSNYYLQDLVNEINSLVVNGIHFKNKTLDVELRCIICDAPAKSFITKTKCQTGYSSCTKCIQEGEYCERRMCFPEMHSAKRNHNDFITQKDEGYHLGRTVLADIPSFDLVGQIPLDYMHLVCVGVVKKLLVCG